VRSLDAEVPRRDEGRARHPWRASAADGRRTAQRTREGIGKIGRITPGSPNTITEVPIPSGQGAEGITVGPDGNIRGGDITNGPDGNLWFTQISQSVWRLAIADCDKCVSAKLKAIGKKESRRLACLAKFANTGDSSGLSNCIAEAESKFTDAFAKAGECGSSVAACEDRVDYCVSQVVANLPDVPSKCEASKLKAASKAAAGLFNCAAKSASRGKPVDPDCTILLPGTKILDTLTAAFTRADASGPCTGDPMLLGFVIELACHVQIPIDDSAGTVTGLVCF
jgi:hypothetical protein